MLSSLQICDDQNKLTKLQKKYGNPQLHPILGAGCIYQPKLLLLFMNPTARNVSAKSDWSGIRAPWLGTKNIWKILYALELISASQFKFIQTAKPSDWTPEFSQSLYQTLSNNKVYITNLAKCTQDDARPLNNSVFKEYLSLTTKEISQISPQKIISFGTQVSSIFLNKTIKLQDCPEDTITISGKKILVYPTYYPVGQGMRNMSQAIDRVRQLI